MIADQYVAHKATNKYWNTGIGLVALKATGVPKSDPKIGKIQKYVSILKYANWLVCFRASSHTNRTASTLERSLELNFQQNFFGRDPPLMQGHLSFVLASL